MHIVDSFVNSGGQANGIRIVYEYYIDHEDGHYHHAKMNLLTGYLQSRNVNSIDTRDSSTPPKLRLFCDIILSNSTKNLRRPRH